MSGLELAGAFAGAFLGGALVALGAALLVVRRAVEKMMGPAALAMMMTAIHGMRPRSAAGPPGR